MTKKRAVVEEIVRGGEVGADRSGPKQQVCFQREIHSPAHYFPSSLPGKGVSERKRNLETQSKDYKLAGLVFLSFHSSLM